MQEISPYFNGIKNKNFISPHYESQFAIGVEKSKTMTNLLKTKVDITDNPMTITQNFPNNRMTISIKNRDNLKTTATSNNDKMNGIENEKKTDNSHKSDDSLKKGQSFTTGMSKSSNTTKSTRAANNFNMTNEDENKMRKRNFDKETEITTSLNLVRKDSQKSRNIRNKLYKPANKTKIVEVFGSPNKFDVFATNTCNDLSFKGQSFNIITCLEEVKNTSTNLTLNRELSTINVIIIFFNQDLTQKSVLRKIESEIKNRENLVRKISGSFINEREESKKNLTEMIMSKTYEIKDLKYEGIKKKIKLSIKDAWKNMTIQNKTILGEFRSKIEYKFALKK